MSPLFPVMQNDLVILRQAMALAVLGRGRVEPNPMVGCILVKDGQVIGQGHHHHFGGPHAEADALAHCTQDPRSATAYVTLEPCCHTNKKTPPCAPSLIDTGIKRIVIGCLDPNPQVNGQAVAMLRNAGVTVDGPILDAECRQLIAPFIAQVVHHRPYVTLKWAQTADGKVAGPAGKPLKISGDRANHLVHQLRARSDAILIGSGTAQADDPLLTIRGVMPLRPSLLRIVLDSRLRLDPLSRLAQSVQKQPQPNSLPRYAGGGSGRGLDATDLRPPPQPSPASTREREQYNPRRQTVVTPSPVLLFCLDIYCDPHRAKALRDRGVEIIPLPGQHHVPFDAVLKELHARNVTHLLIEPGPTLAHALLSPINLSLVDRLWIIQSPNLVNDPSAPDAVTIPDHFIETGRRILEPDELTEYLNPQSKVFFHPSPSPDFFQLTDCIKNI